MVPLTLVQITGLGNVAPAMVLPVTSRFTSQMVTVPPKARTLRIPTLVMIAAGLDHYMEESHAASACSSHFMQLSTLSINVALAGLNISIKHFKRMEPNSVRNRQL
jgi:uncharacterized membrane protein